MAAARLGLKEETSLIQAFHSYSLIQRQYKAFETECQCTKAMHAEYRRRREQGGKTLVIDGTGFRWEGLGNSGTRWMGLLRYGQATGRNTYLHIARECNKAPPVRRALLRPLSTVGSQLPASAPCRLDIGAYFTGYNNTDWYWSGQAAKVRRWHAARGERPLVLMCVPELLKPSRSDCVLMVVVSAHPHVFLQVRVPSARRRHRLLHRPAPHAQRFSAHPSRTCWFAQLVALNT